MWRRADVAAAQLLHGSDAGAQRQRQLAEREHHELLEARRRADEAGEEARRAGAEVVEGRAEVMELRSQLRRLHERL
eukprot:SAG25_NODE_11703_length_298_cov_0.477387_1_plen_76_part_01